MNVHVSVCVCVYNCIYLCVLQVRDRRSPIHWLVLCSACHSWRSVSHMLLQNVHRRETVSAQCACVCLFVCTCTCGSVCVSNKRYKDFGYYMSVWHVIRLSLTLFSSILAPTSPEALCILGLRQQHGVKLPAPMAEMRMCEDLVRHLHPSQSKSI